MSDLTGEQGLTMYGRVLTGDETALELEKLARTQYLKTKMRKKLAQDIGDSPDNVADMTRAIMLGMAISEGLVTDTQIITRYHLYVQDMVQDYGGAEAIMDVLEYDKTALEQHVVAGYFLVKQTVDEATDADEVRMIDLPGEPVNEEEV